MQKLALIRNLRAKVYRLEKRVKELSASSQYWENEYKNEKAKNKIADSEFLKMF